MNYEEPEMIKLTVEEENDSAVGPDGCSTAYTGCCWKD